MTFIRYFFLAVALTPLAPAANTPSSQPSSPNIILITLDTTRADRMGFLGSKRGLTPNLDELAKQSAVFTHAYAEVPITPASHASILTGTYPQFHHINDFQTALAADLPYAPDILKAQGYRTAAFIGSIILNSEGAQAPGFNRGFDLYDAGYHNEGPGQDRYKTMQRRGAEVVARALAWLEKNPKGPFFVWVHLYDAHDPYDPPEPYKTKYASAPYDGAIAYEDSAVGQLLRQLKQRGFYDKTLIAVMADHGESLGAHGEDEHGVFLYDETMHVPLTIKLPGQIDGQRIENIVELVDVLPTLLQETGVAVPKDVQGQSLLPLIAASHAPAAAWHDQSAYAQSIYPHDAYGWSATRSWRTGKFLYIQAPRRELYDQNADPAAAHNLASSSPAIADTLAAQLQSYREKTSSSREAPRIVMDAAAQQQLGALGYAASTGNRSAPDIDNGPDPKDKIEIANTIHRADMLQEDMHFEESIKLIEEVLAKEPGLHYYSMLATWLIQQEQFDKAVPVLRKALQVEGDAPATHLLLGKSLLANGNFEGAIPELEAAIAKVPNAVDAHSYLELAYSRVNRPADAIRECQTVLRYVPDDYGSYLILGQSLAASGNPAAGVEALKKAIATQPDNPAAHAFLADVYDQLGKKSDADRERSEAQRLQDTPKQ